MKKNKQNNLIKETHSCGAILVPHDERDYKAHEHIAMGVRPEEYYPPEYAPLIYQGNIGSCVAHAIATLKWYQEYYERKSWDKFSTDFVYHNRDLDDYQGEGMVVSQACSHICNDGICTFDELPSNTAYPNAYVTAQINKLKPNAIKNKGLKYVRCETKEEICEAIYQYKGAIVSVQVCTSFDSFVLRKSLKDAILPQPSESENKRGGHAICAIGYTKDGIIIQNSWGSPWGYKGLAILPWGYTPIYDIYAIIDERKTWNIVELTIDSKDATINNEPKVLDAPAIIKNQRTFVPLRFIGEALHAKVEWKNDTRSIIINDGANTVQMQIGNKVAYKNNNVLTLDVAPFIQQDRTYVPLRAISEALNADVEWNANKRKVIVRKEVK